MRTTLKKEQYQLHISGLIEEEGHIKIATFRRVMDALYSTAERTTRLVATGSGGGKGARPSWLDDTIDIVITGMHSGSTVIDLEAPQIGETAYSKFAQQDLWATMPSLDETALDLAARSINETQIENPNGDYFDSSVLEAILKFKHAAGVPGVRYELVSKSKENGQFSLDDDRCLSIQERLKAIPAPRAYIVTGRLDEIKYGYKRFRLLVGNNSVLLGRLGAPLSVEALRPQWGKQTTIEGMVHFKANGQPRLIEARRISDHLGTDEVFEEIPKASIQESLIPLSIERKQERSFDPIELEDKWPGAENIEDLLTQLD